MFLLEFLEEEVKSLLRGKPAEHAGSFHGSFHWIEPSFFHGKTFWKIETKAREFPDPFQTGKHCFFPADKGVEKYKKFPRLSLQLNFEFFSGDLEREFMYLTSFFSRIQERG
jgi:hypothetical protein